MAISTVSVSYDGTSTTGLQIKATANSTVSNPVFASVSGTFSYAISNVLVPTPAQIAELPFTAFGTVTGYTQGTSATRINILVNQTPIPWATLFGYYIFIKYDLTFDGQIVSYYFTVGGGGDFIGLKGKVGSFDSDALIGKSSNTYRAFFGVALEGSYGYNKSLFSGLVQQLKVIFDVWDGAQKTHREIVVNNTGSGELLPNPVQGAKLIAVDNLKYELTDTMGNIHKYEPKISFTYWLYTETSTIPNLVHKPLEIWGVHGSLISGGYIWGSSRWGNGGKSIVKINMSNLDDVSYINTIHPTLGQTIQNIEQMVRVGNYIYCIGDPSVLIQINAITNTYKVFTIPNLYGRLIFIYQGDGGLIKCRAIDLESPTLQNGAAIPYIDAVKYSSHHDGWNKVVHSAVIDDNYIYGSYTTGIYSAEKPFYLTKVNKNTLQLEGWIAIPQSTDDMTQNDEYLYFGIELQPTASKDEFGYGWGAYAVRKSDLALFGVNKLGIADNPPYTASYASLFFGKTLLDSKTNNRIYVLNTENTESWSLGWDHAPIVRDYSYTIPGIGVINELLLNYDTQTFYGFVWTVNNGAKASGLVSFKLPDIVFKSIPVVSGVDPLVIVPNSQYTLRASIDDTGNDAITSAGFLFGNSADNLTENLSVTTSLGSKSATLNITDGKTKYYRFYATNSEGTAQTPVRTLEVLDTPLITILEPVAVIQNQQYTLRSTIDGTGGAPITAAGFKIGNNASNLTENLSVTTSLGAKSATLNITDGVTKYVQFYATNSEGTTNSQIKTIVVGTPDEYIIKGRVFRDGSLQSGATILLIDIATNEVLQSSITNSSGEYNFTGLTPLKKYYVAGWYSDFRIVSKLLTPFKV
jgi:hypothetical protein